jgi:hypothetical protein
MNPNDSSATRSRLDNTPKRDDIQLLRMLAVLAVAIGIPLLVLQVIKIRRHSQSLHWPAVDGVVIHSDYRSWTRAGLRGSTRHHAQGNMSYRYTVDGTNYISKRLYLWSADDEVGGDDAEYVRLNPVGSLVTVHYDARHPENAVLVPGPNKLASGSTLLVGCGSVAAGVLLWRRACRKPSKAEI